MPLEGAEWVEVLDTTDPTGAPNEKEMYGVKRSM